MKKKHIDSFNDKTVLVKISHAQVSELLEVAEKQVTERLTSAVTPHRVRQRLFIKWQFYIIHINRIYQSI